MNSGSLRALFTRATTRVTPNSALASNAVARLALSSPVAAITTSHISIPDFCIEINSQASASSHSASGTVRGW
nr:hypothetical protein CPGR_06116 [Mycolicibacter nonchromogenicus]